MNARRRRPSPGKIERVRLNRRQPGMSIDELALMLEIEVEFGRTSDFRRRLQRALDDAWKQGAAAKSNKGKASAVMP